MWARTLRAGCPRPLHRSVRFSRLRLPKRHYNGQQHQGPHTTYFQEPPTPPKPRRRILRSLLFGTSFTLLGAYINAWLYDVPIFGIGLSEEDLQALESGSPFLPDGQENLVRALATGAQDAAAREVPAMDLERAQEYLQLRAGYSVTRTAVGHSCQLPSNLPCEDTEHAGAYTLFNDGERDWCTWSIFDGHAGPRTAQLLQQILPTAVGAQLWESGCMGRPYRPGDEGVVRTIKRAFETVDGGILTAAQAGAERSLGLAKSICVLAPAMSGSCALLTLFDPVNEVLRVANVGDSRAVLGRYSAEEGKYVAQPLSTDQTGFNEAEVARLQQAHPGEDPVEKTTGRVFGIAVSRAFGDARWKWPEELTRLVHEKFWGPAPRPNSVIKTPPYLTAEPEVTETKIETGKGGSRADFMIMASDGLWDHMSSEDAVLCVERWLEKFRPDGFIEEQIRQQKQDSQGYLSALLSMLPFRSSSAGPGLHSEPPKHPAFTDFAGPDEDPETFWSEEERALKWKVSPKHFVTEDDHAGVHLIKNALGGRRRELFLGVLSVQPPLSRSVRDDISVQVVFFGVDGGRGLDLGGEGR